MPLWQLKLGEHLSNKGNDGNFIDQDRWRLPLVTHICQFYRMMNVGGGLSWSQVRSQVESLLQGTSESHSDFQ